MTSSGVHGSEDTVLRESYGDGAGPVYLANLEEGIDPAVDVFQLIW